MTLQPSLTAGWTNDIRGHHAGHKLNRAMDLHRRQLRRNAKVLPCGKLTFDLMALLAARAPGVVSREVVAAQLWNGRFVTPATIKRRVALLRRALDDDPRRPVFIRTVSRHGYQFVFSEVREEPDALLAGAEPLFLNTTADTGYLPDFSHISERTWQRVQLVYICSPGNPTGAVMGLPELQALIELADRHDFVIASDECYSEIYFDEAAPRFRDYLESQRHYQKNRLELADGDLRQRLGQRQLAFLKQA